ncbi:hypothetical protein ACSSS7_000660 [Eimeria intestinalis]
MKKGAAEKQQQPKTPATAKVDTRGLFFGETRGPQGFVIDKGGQHLMRAGFEPSTRPIGTGASLSDSAGAAATTRAQLHPVLLRGKGQEGLFDNIGEDLFYKSVNEEGERKKVEVIYVGLDKERQAFEDSRAHMPWLSLQFDSPLRKTLIRRYHLRIEPSGIERFLHSLCCRKHQQQQQQRPAAAAAAAAAGVSDSREAPLPQSVIVGLPRLLVVGPQGQEYHWLQCEHDSPVVLREWDYEAFRWPPAPDASGDKGDSCTSRPHGGDTRDNRQDFADIDWPLTPEVAAAWPMERERQQQHGRHEE